MTFELTILGCNSAIPAHDRFPSAQVLNIQDQLYLIDCGEGTQVRMQQYKVKRNRIKQIFISHLHGDHIFGLIGLLTSYSLMRREDPLDIFAPPGLEEIISVQLKYIQNVLTYPLRMYPVDTKKQALIFDDDRMEVETIPLLHRIPTVGYLFREKPRPRHFLAEKQVQYNIPVEKIEGIKQGDDFVTTNGERIPNEELTDTPPPPRSFAYCSDTAFNEAMIPQIKGVDMLYHESTFLHERKDLAHITQHSTARQAAEIAKKAKVGMLIIGHYSTRYKDLRPILDEAKAYFSNTLLGEEGKTYDLTIN